jgi:hypothetical protein
MRDVFLFISWFSNALSIMLYARCTTQGPADQEFPLGSFENPFILDDYSDSHVTYIGTIVIVKLLLKSLTYPSEEAYVLFLSG